MWRSPVWRLAAVGAVVVVWGVSVGLAKSDAASRVSWPFWKTTEHTTFNPYAPHGRYRGGSAVPPRRCTITGTPGNDVLRGTPGKDVICGLGGNDRIHGKGGNDVIDGASGNDRIAGGAGNARLIGGAGKDAIDGGAGGDAMFGAAGNDRLFGGAGPDRIYAGTGGDLVRGGSGADEIVGEPGHDRLFGGKGNEVIVSKDGSRDLVTGGPGKKDTTVADRPGARRTPRDSLSDVEATTLPPLAVGQTCSSSGDGVVVSCQATGQFGNVPENETVQFKNTSGSTGNLNYVGLHGGQDTIGLDPGETGNAGLGAGHYGSGWELFLEDLPPGSSTTTFTVTSVQGPNLQSLSVGQSCTVTGVVYCQLTGQFGNVPENEWVWFKNESQTSKVWLDYKGLHGGPDSLTLEPGETGKVGLGAGHYGEDGELVAGLDNGSSATLTVTDIEPEN